MPTQIRFQIQDRVGPMTRQGGMKQAARDWLNRTDATGTERLFKLLFTRLTH